VEQKICLDTNACIEIANETQIGKKILSMIENSEIFISSISVFELYLRKYNIDNIDFLLERFNILSFDEVCAKEGSNISKELAKGGKLIDFRDIFIAAICTVNNCSLLTLNLRHFKNIKKLKITKL